MYFFFFFQAEDGIRDRSPSRGLGDVYKRQDPPSYGRGPKGEIWKIEEKIYPFIELCTKILSDDPLFFLVNSYTTGLQPAVLTYMLETQVAAKFGGKVVSDEIGLPVSSNGLVLPCGASGRWEK